MSIVKVKLTVTNLLTIQLNLEGAQENDFKI